MTHSHNKEHHEKHKEGKAGKGEHEHKNKNTHHGHHGSASSSKSHHRHQATNKAGISSGATKALEVLTHKATPTTGKNDSKPPIAPKTNIVKQGANNNKDAKNNNETKPNEDAKKDENKSEKKGKKKKMKDFFTRNKEGSNKETKKIKTKTLLVGQDAKKAYCSRLIRSLIPLRYFALIFGQWPLTYHEEQDGTYTFKFSWYHFNACYFLIMMSVSYYALAFGGWNLYATIVDVHEVRSNGTDRLEERWYEKSLMHRHFMWVISCAAAVVQTSCSMYHIFKNRHYMPTVFTFYTKVVHQLHADLSRGVLCSSLILIIIYFATTIPIMVMGFLRFAPVTVSTPTLFGVYLFRMFFWKSGVWIVENTNERVTLQAFGAIFLFIIYTSSKIQMFIFVFHCKLLRNAFACWNGRAYIALMKGQKYFLTQEGQVTFELLYKDHCVILDILEAANRLSSRVIEMYYGVQTATIFFEFYFFLRTARYGDSKHSSGDKGFMRPNDWIPGLLLSFQSIIIAVYTAQVASQVGKEAMAGLDIVRRKTMLNRKTDGELLFQLSMQASFNSFQRFDFSGGGYQLMNFDWIMNYVNNIASYFIILYQFQPIMDRYSKGQWEQRSNLGKFLAEIEGLPPDHYLSSKPPDIIKYNLPNN